VDLAAYVIRYLIKNKISVFTNDEFPFDATKINVYVFGSSKNIENAVGNELYTKA